MEMLQERNVGNDYEVAYRCNENLIKVVRVNSKKLFSKHRSFLEIQKTGLDFHAESLEFEDGVAYTHNKQGLGWSSMLPGLDLEATQTKELLTEYAMEFKDIFASNEKLQEYLPTVFAQLQDYLPSVDGAAEESEEVGGDSSDE